MNLVLNLKLEYYWVKVHLEEFINVKVKDNYYIYRNYFNPVIVILI